MHKWKRMIWRILLSACLLTALPVTHPSAEPLSIKRQQELAYLVRQDCGSCHGMTLKGGLGSALLPENLKDSEAEILAGIILDGIPETPMPPWRGLLKENEAMWIAKALKKGLTK